MVINAAVPSVSITHHSIPSSGHFVFLGFDSQFVFKCADLLRDNALAFRGSGFSPAISALNSGPQILRTSGPVYHL